MLIEKSVIHIGYIHHEIYSVSRWLAFVTSFQDECLLGRWLAFVTSFQDECLLGRWLDLWRHFKANVCWEDGLICDVISRRIFAGKMACICDVISRRMFAGKTACICDHYLSLFSQSKLIEIRRHQVSHLF